MDPEQRILREWIKFFVELQIIFVFEFARRFCPERRGIVDDAVGRDRFVFWFAFLVDTVFNALFLRAKLDLYRKELAILFKN